MIPAEAVIAATKVLYADKMSNHSGDNAPQIIDACEVAVKKILESAAPHMLAEAWGEGHGAGWNDCLLALENGGAKTSANPYRPTDAV